MSNYPKIKMKINNTQYTQIRKDQEGKIIWWKNVPLVAENVPASGLHIINGESSGNHYDHYLGKKDTSKDSQTTEGIGGMIIRKNELFASPSGKILVLTGPSGIPTYISREIFEKNKLDYRVVLEKEGVVFVVAELHTSVEKKEVKE